MKTPSTSWLEEVKQAFIARSKELSGSKEKCMDREQWRNFVNCTNCGIIIHLTRNNEEVESNVPISAATGSLGGAEPMEPEFYKSSIASV